MCMCMCMRMHMCMCICIYVYVCACACAVLGYMHVYVHVHVYAYVYVRHPVLPVLQACWPLLQSAAQTFKAFPAVVQASSKQHVVSSKSCEQWVVSSE